MWLVIPLVLWDELTENGQYWPDLPGLWERMTRTVFARVNIVWALLCLPFCLMGQPLAFAALFLPWVVRRAGRFILLG